MTYAYRRELKQPNALQRIDFGNPKLAPAIRMIARDLRTAARVWTPPAGVRLRLLRLAGEGAAECFVLEPETEGPLPGMLYCHGGAFLLPVSVTALRLAALYAARLNMRVFVPEYRLLPENPYPTPFQDCLAAWRAMTAESGGPCLLYGESAGGTIAAGLAQWLRDHRQRQPVGQVLIYPALDDRFEAYPSMDAFPEAAWSRSSNAYMWREYLRDGGRAAPYAVPMRCAELAGLPPAYIEPQEMDILRDEAVAYAEKLRRAGEPVELNLIEGSYHGFDADLENPFVQQIVKQRVRAMAGMLEQGEKERQP